MTWNYRVIRSAEGAFGLYEVYYNQDDVPIARSSTPITFVCDEEEGKEGILESLKLALESAERLEVLDDPWPE
jgi:hypothetical protein